MSDVEEEKPDGITEEEKLRLQLAWTELTNVQLQIRILRGDLLQAERLLKDKGDAMQAVRDDIVAKYGVDPTTTTIGPDGRFTPITPELRAAAHNIPRF